MPQNYQFSESAEIGKNHQMRIETHEIDTQARKIVPIALPRQWEFRDVTGRDYGIP